MVCDARALVSVLTLARTGANGARRLKDEEAAMKTTRLKHDAPRQTGSQCTVEVKTGQKNGRQGEKPGGKPSGDDAAAVTFALQWCSARERYSPKARAELRRDAVAVCMGGFWVGVCMGEVGERGERSIGGGGPSTLFTMGE